MLIALHYCRKDQPQAARLAEWLVEIGPFKHDILIARDHRAAPITAFEKAFRVSTEFVIRDDTTDAWPFSANHAFRKIGKHIQHSLGAQAFLYIEPDAVVLRASAFDEIEAEYQQALAVGKLFLGQLIDQRGLGIDSPPHMSGVGVFPADLVQHAGVIYQADNIPFDIIAGPQIVPRLMQSELILHSWKAAPFDSWADVERRIFAVRPKCAIFHSDKSGSLLGLLRERKNQAGSTPANAEESIVKPHGSAAMGFESPISSTLPTPVLAPMLIVSDDRAVEIPSGSDVSLGMSRTPLKFYEFPHVKDIVLEPWMGQTPWDSKDDSIAEIRQLTERLKQFSISGPTVRFVRAALHDAGVIVLPYRFRKRKGWKKKR